ncbi:conserved hypothetical protein [Theileria equi strain WA]|uniref:Uncharacterized protein n=1 Tax=Theileria equi strain WA TaxID=1537102 RepID=L1LD64_THEEQ|nr:conserved hypothetical protein [Theileria equi strain WA]EKX73118.1 conserved hypothetical protein [Theileria equi strain WA]|eukprot:XP_004832570.1 conserved hypothetical protein [Theileria equi strain WA]
MRSISSSRSRSMSLSRSVSTKRSMSLDNTTNTGNNNTNKPRTYSKDTSTDSKRGTRRGFRYSSSVDSTSSYDNKYHNYKKFKERSLSKNKRRKTRRSVSRSFDRYRSRSAKRRSRDSHRHSSRDSRKGHHRHSRRVRKYSSSRSRSPKRDRYSRRSTDSLGRDRRTDHRRPSDRDFKNSTDRHTKGHRDDPERAHRKSVDRRNTYKSPRRDYNRRDLSNEKFATERKYRSSRSHSSFEKRRSRRSFHRKSPGRDRTSPYRIRNRGYDPAMNREADTFRFVNRRNAIGKTRDHGHRRDFKAILQNQNFLKRELSGLRKNGLLKEDEKLLKVDRNEHTPFLLKIATQFDDEMEGDKKNEELHLYVWLDTSLRDIVNLVKDICPRTRTENKFWVFKQISDGNVGDEVGNLHCNKLNYKEDSKTLASFKFSIGNSLSLSFKE